jgi:dTDP-4-amino-4,6-dideoxygalactose transaminase
MVLNKKISLFHIPSYKINTGNFTNLLHDKVVQEFEEEFADYTGFKYAVGLNSATSAIQCIFSDFYKKELGQTDTLINVPNLIPPVVVNALINSGNKVQLVDNHWWVGTWYILHRFSDCVVVDSAQ